MLSSKLSADGVAAESAEEEVQAHTALACNSILDECHWRSDTGYGGRMMPGA